MTTYPVMYPSFRRYILDEETMLPLKVETWRLDIYAEEPEFVLDHELTTHYEMEDLSPQSFDKLSNQMLEDPALAFKYQVTKTQKGAASFIFECDKECQIEIFCDTQTSTYLDSRECRGLKRIDAAEDPAYALTTAIMQPWYTYEEFP